MDYSKLSKEETETLSELLLRNEANNCQNFWEDYSRYDSSGYEGHKDWRRQYLAQKIVDTKPKSVLEVGCFGGYNLRHINRLDPSIELTGFDINKKALSYAKEKLPSINAVNGSLYELTNYFKDNSFDVVFTAGVLIHIPSLNNEGTSFIKLAASNIAKVSSNFVFHAEHHGENYTPMPNKAHGNIMSMRYIHNFNDLYKDSGSIQIEQAPDPSSGFEQIIKVSLNK